MKKLQASSFVLISFLIAFSAYGQVKPKKIQFLPGLELRKGLAFKENGEKPFTGLSKSTYNNGNPYVTATFKNGKLDGSYTAYYANGQKMGVSHYKLGIKQGESIAWHENGRIASKINFKQGKREGLLEIFYPSGRLSVEAFFKEGKLDSTYTEWKKDGSLHLIGNYDEDELLKKETFE